MTTLYYRSGSTDAEPFTLEDLARLANAGQLRPTDFVRQGTHGRWMPAGQLVGLPFVRMSEPPPIPPNSEVRFPQLDPRPRTQQFSRPSSMGWIVGGVVAAGAILGIGLLLFFAVGMSTVSPGFGGPGMRIQMSWRDATSELQPIAQGLSDQQIAVLGLVALATDTAFYGARVRITNTGSAAVQVLPENLRMHLGEESVGVVTMNDPRFLQRTVLEPGYYVEGLVIYQATIMAGATIQQGGGSMSYTDPSIAVSY